MPVLRLRRSLAVPLAGLLRGLALALAMTLILSGCGAKDDLPTSGDQGSSAGAGEDGADEDDEADEADEDDEPAPDPGYQAPTLGQCYRMTGAQSRTSVSTGRQTSCKKPHNSVVAYVGFVPRAVTARTRLAKRRALGMRVCERAYRRVVGGTLADRATSILTWTLFTPGQDQLERGARWIRCDVIARSGKQLIELPRRQPLLAQGVPEQLRTCQHAAGADISCARTHSYRVEAVYRVIGDAYPDPARYTPVARGRCEELMGAFGGFWQPPSREGWAAGDRFIRCLSPRPDASQGDAP